MKISVWGMAYAVVVAVAALFSAASYALCIGEACRLAGPFSGAHLIVCLWTECRDVWLAYLSIPLNVVALPWSWLAWRVGSWSQSIYFAWATLLAGLAINFYLLAYYLFGKKDPGKER